MLDFNLLVAWCAILVGLLAGAVQGLSFHRDDWLGGYASWPRRLTRLGHISFFGLGLLNLAFVLTVERGAALSTPAPTSLALASWLFAGGAASMPLACYASAFRSAWRRIFPLPVGMLVAAVICLLVWELGR